MYRLSLEVVKLALLRLVFSISAFPKTGTKPLTCLYLLLGVRAILTLPHDSLALRRCIANNGHECPKVITKK